MGPTASNPIEIGVPRTRQAQALWLVFSDRDDKERSARVTELLSQARRGEASLDGLFEARRDDRLVGAVLASIMPGRTASISPPELVRGEPAATASLLLEAVDRYLSVERVSMSQALLDVDSGRKAALLRDAGYRYLAELLYLECPVARFPTEPPVGRLAFEAHKPEGRARLGHIVGRTYQGSLDCPLLEGVRSMEDILDGYEKTGVFHADRWFIVRHDDRDVGCLLLTEHGEKGVWELIYMGLAPAVRGRGFGLDVTRHGQWIARRAGCRRMVAAVDAANHPAIRMYTAAGFSTWDRRRVFLKVFGP